MDSTTILPSLEAESSFISSPYAKAAIIIGIAVLCLLIFLCEDMCCRPLCVRCGFENRPKNIEDVEEEMQVFTSKPSAPEDSFYESNLKSFTSK